ncbi:DDRGK domain-containing protein 1 [Trichoplax sp. H2]|uniref:DDRGK domain-containing protein 1 n=1 Tax=Trichoplax adhaerens TaxID=10228 RepID=DDRGK_TRIAD|nr:hypothetical protein TRIADDRAFT_58679 [Trichoplax adhaerens]B3S3D5.1 RecName: Full=DDRGK domain-containing protein 1; Flags: Precursor [Trichoplax adhaerens]EDV22950.1 hypothetical protein TRIADDRAFT_58679 [Trichoplax adhaerens]RDD41643.1 DDRGK domain-containing protein 1 [Trichoplax sp. H2]|eukprot:XP_002114816.1 hypothetical protein TRIADDRAFT_58679 [Trichoplax adhaerens]
MAAIIYLAIAAVASILLFVAVKLLSTDTKTEIRTDDDVGELIGRENPVPQRPRARARRGLRNKTNRSKTQRQHDNDYDDYDDEYQDDGFLEEPVYDRKMGTKKLRKLEEKAEKKAMREQMEAEREDKINRQELREQNRRKEEERKAKEREEKEEAERKLKEEQEKREYEEYLRLKESFSVENEGSGEAEIAQESQSLLQEFIDYIKNNKVVLLEDVAAHFKLRTEDVINRIQTLQSMDRLTGVVDDRGKYIYISVEELNAIAKFIKQRGRVSISELAESSNSLINLQSDSKASHTIESVNDSPAEISVNA